MQDRGGITSRYGFLAAISTVVVLSFALLTLAVWAGNGLLDNWWLFAFPVPLFLISDHHWQGLSNSRRALVTGAMLAIVLLFTLLCLQIILANIQLKPEWDIKNLWLHARLAAQGKNFYDLEQARQLAYQYGPPSPLLLELIDFPYPPPTMLLVVPMGWFEMETAFPLWQGLQMLFLASAVVLLWHMFLREHGWSGLALAGVLVAGFHPTIDTVYAGQTNFLVLLLLLMFWNDQDRRRGGIWLALAIFVKPFMAVLLLYLVLKRQWRALIGTISTGMTASLLSIVVFGPGIFFSYFTDSPLANYGTYRLTMSFNQSLLATVLRLTHYDFSAGSGFTHPLFLASASFFVLVTAWLIYHLNDERRDWGLALVVVLALLIYPHSLRYYDVLLVVPLALIWSQRRQMPGGAWGAVAFMSLEYLLASYRPGDAVFWVMLFCWLALVLIAICQLGVFRLSRIVYP